VGFRYAHAAESCSIRCITVRRKALAAHSKQGWVYILDRITGKPILPFAEKPFPQEARQKTSPTQPIPAGDPTAPQCAELVKDYQPGCMYTPVWSDSKIAQPSASADWAPGAYDPRSGILFSPRHVDTEVQHHRPRVGSGTREYGLITALDRAPISRCGRKKSRTWRIRERRAGYGGRAAVPRRQRWILPRVDSKTGEEPWRFQTGFGADAPAATAKSTASSTWPSPRGPRRVWGSSRDLVWSFKSAGG
jgi:alcohol dehydrogenase (cytochrome c)